MKRVCLFILFALLLSSCGGGKSTFNTLGTVTTGTSTGTGTGTGVTHNLITGAAQGIYFGTYSQSLWAYAIVLPDDTFYSIYGGVAGGSLQEPWGMLQGKGSSYDDGQYEARLTNFTFVTTFALDFDAKYVAGSSLIGKFTNPGNGANWTIEATVLPASEIDFNSPAMLSHLTGVWVSWFVTHPFDGWWPGTLTISSTGQFTGDLPDAPCSFTGSMAPDSSKKNFFNVTITAPCQPTQTGSGVAFERLLPDGKTRQLIVITTLPNGTGFAFAATR